MGGLVQAFEIGVATCHNRLVRAIRTQVYMYQKTNVMSCKWLKTWQSGVFKLLQNMSMWLLLCVQLGHAWRLSDIPQTSF